MHFHSFLFIRACRWNEGDWLFHARVCLHNLNCRLKRHRLHKNNWPLYASTDSKSSSISHTLDTFYFKIGICIRFRHCQRKFPFALVVRIMEHRLDAKTFSAVSSRLLLSFGNTESIPFGHSSIQLATGKTKAVSSSRASFLIKTTYKFNAKQTKGVWLIFRTARKG